MDETSTIAALATAPAPAGIAVIRVSGPRTRTALRALFKGKQSVLADPRRLVYGHLVDHKSGDVIDKALAVFMPGPASYTGEDVAEFQFHGSPLLVEKILRSLFSFGISPAEPGEFTKRAFLNGKLDLAQAEAVADLISATNDQALKIAGEHLKGRFSETITTIGEPLRDVVAQLEASIDFPDEDISPDHITLLRACCQKAQNEISALLRSYSYGQTVKEGYRVLLLGRPNAGKSSLLNVLLGRERAIVTEIAGTTRDLIEESALLSGFQFIFCDSAGITDSTDRVEQIGISLAKERVEWADLVLLLVDSTDKDDAWKSVLAEVQGKAQQIWMITNKIDVNPQAFSQFYCDSHICRQNFFISAKSRTGVESLIAALVDEVKGRSRGKTESGHIVTNERHRSRLERAGTALSMATDAMDNKLPTEIISAEIRIALTALEEIVGKTYTEDILGRIFSKFCVGK